MQTASAQSSLSQAVKFLEKKFKVPYDQSVGGGIFRELINLTPSNHHFKSLAHNPTILGLFFSILNQFTNTSDFVVGGELISLNNSDSTVNLNNILLEASSVDCKDHHQSVQVRRREADALENAQRSRAAAEQGERTAEQAKGCQHRKEDADDQCAVRDDAAQQCVKVGHAEFGRLVEDGDHEQEADQRGGVNNTVVEVLVYGTAWSQQPSGIELIYDLRCTAQP